MTVTFDQVKELLGAFEERLNIRLSKNEARLEILEMQSRAVASAPMIPTYSRGRSYHSVEFSQSVSGSRSQRQGRY